MKKVGKNRFKIYGNSKINGWEVVSNKKDLEEAIKIAKRLTSKEYYSYLIKETGPEGDSVVMQESLYDECEVEYVDNVKEKYKVRAMEFKVKEKEKVKNKPSRMKKKEDLRRMTQDYIDR